jgi:hypothetical protein
MKCITLGFLMEKYTLATSEFKEMVQNRSQEIFQYLIGREIFWFPEIGRCVFSGTLL